MLLTRSELKKLIEANLFDHELSLLEEGANLNEVGISSSALAMTTVARIANQAEGDPARASSLAQKVRDIVKKKEASPLSRRMQRRLDRTATAGGVKFLDLISDKASGDVFRIWARKNHEQLATAKRNKRFKFNDKKVRGLDLDEPTEKSSWNNSYMRYAFKVLGDKFKTAMEEEQAAALKAEIEKRKAQLKKDAFDDYVQAVEQYYKTASELMAKPFRDGVLNKTFDNPFELFKNLIAKQSDNEGARFILPIILQAEKLFGPNAEAQDIVDAKAEDLANLMQKSLAIDKATVKLKDKKAAGQMSAGRYAKVLGANISLAASLMFSARANYDTQISLIDADESDQLAGGMSDSAGANPDA